MRLPALSLRFVPFVRFPKHGKKITETPYYACTGEALPSLSMTERGTSSLLIPERQNDAVHSMLCDAM